MMACLRTNVVTKHPSILKEEKSYFAEKKKCFQDKQYVLRVRGRQIRRVNKRGIIRSRKQGGFPEKGNFRNKI